MDHGVVASERVGLIGNQAGFFDAGQVPDDDVLGCREPLTSVTGALIVARVQRDRVADMGKQLGRHQPEPVARTSDQNPCHLPSLVGSFAVIIDGLGEAGRGRLGSRLRSDEPPRWPRIVDAMGLFPILGIDVCSGGPWVSRVHGPSACLVFAPRGTP